MRILIPLSILLLGPPVLTAQPPTPPPDPAPAAPKLIRTLPGLTIDPAGRKVIAEGRVCLRDDVLEFVACSPGTKEHESLFVLGAQPKHLHLGLLLIGLRPGRPVRWVGDRFIPPAGDRVNIRVRWTDPELECDEILELLKMGLGEQEARKRLQEYGGRIKLTRTDLSRLNDAKAPKSLVEFLRRAAEQWMQKKPNVQTTHEVPVYDWIRSTKTKKTMQPTGWVFAGSRSLPDGSYWADGDGTIVSVSNFESTVLDVPMESTKENAALMWEANTEAIPRVGTKLEVIFSAAAPPAPRGMTVAVAPDGTMTLDGKPITAGQLAERFEGLSPLDKQHIRVVIAADPKTAFGKVVGVLDLLAEAGIPHIRFKAIPAQP
jgi:hypothetical protein